MLQDSLVNASVALSPSGLVYLNKFYSQEKVAAEFIQKIEPLFSQSSAHGLLYLGLASQLGPL